MKKPLLYHRRHYFSDTLVKLSWWHILFSLQSLLKSTVICQHLYRVTVSKCYLCVVICRKVGINTSGKTSSIKQTWFFHLHKNIVSPVAFLLSNTGVVYPSISVNNICKPTFGWCCCVTLILNLYYIFRMVYALIFKGSLSNLCNSVCAVIRNVLLLD